MKQRLWSLSRPFCPETKRIQRLQVLLSTPTVNFRGCAIWRCQNDLSSAMLFGLFGQNIFYSYAGYLVHVSRTLSSWSRSWLHWQPLKHRTMSRSVCTLVLSYIGQTTSCGYESEWTLSNVMSDIFDHSCDLIIQSLAPSQGCTTLWDYLKGLSPALQVLSFCGRQLQLHCHNKPKMTKLLKVHLVEIGMFSTEWGMSDMEALCK